MGVPEPILCPEERERRRMCWSNQRNLHHRTCAGTGKKIITNYSPDKTFPVYDINHWFSSDWDPLATGRDFDFSRPFFDQFKELMEVSPVPALQRSPEYDENSDFTNYAGKNKNCYLIFDSDKNWDCAYSYSINDCKNVIDSYRMDACELCYECIDCSQCYEGRFLQNCTNCNESAFLKNCIGCNHCFGSVNLRNKEYYFMNESLGKDAYFEKIKSLDLDTHAGLLKLRQQFTEHAKKFPVRFMEGVQNEDVLGNYLTNCKNAQYCFDSRKLWDCKYVSQGFDTARNCMDCTEVGDEVELLYECYCLGYTAYNNRFCTHQLGSSSDLTYCFFTPYCKSCFGCVGQHHGQFRILNKQYTEDEYNDLVGRIIEHMKKTGEWGEFFPASLSPQGYNESMAIEHFPLTKEEALSRGYNWKEEDKGAKYDGPQYRVPDSIEEVDESICDQILTCSRTGKHYRVVKPEFEFYKKMNLPIPTVCPDERHLLRVGLRNPRTLYKRNCGNCQVEFQTTCAPERPEKVLCESCYLQEVN